MHLHAEPQEKEAETVVTESAKLFSVSLIVGEGDTEDTLQLSFEPSADDILEAVSGQLQVRVHCNLQTCLCISLPYAWNFHEENSLS